MRTGIDRKVLAEVGFNVRPLVEDGTANPKARYQTTAFPLLYGSGRFPHSPGNFDLVNEGFNRAWIRRVNILHLLPFHSVLWQMRCQSARPSPWRKNQPPLRQRQSFQIRVDFLRLEPETPSQKIKEERRLLERLQEPIS